MLKAQRKEPSYSERVFRLPFPQCMGRSNQPWKKRFQRVVGGSAVKSTNTINIRTNEFLNRLGETG